MIEHLSPHLQQEIRPLYERWSPFVEKFRGRVNEALAEADAGLTGLIQQHATDYGPMGAAFTALQSRFHGLSTKLDQAAEKIEEQIWEIMFRDNISPQDMDVLNRLHTDFTRQHRALSDELDEQYETINTKKSAEWARHLRQLAQAELKTEIACSQCGSPFQLTVFWQASNETCPHCQAVNSVTPGTAAYSFFAGNGLHALSHEQAFEEWKAEQRAKKTLDDFRQPTAYDHWQYLQAAHTYWTRYYQAVQQMHPGFAQAYGSIEAAVEAKLKHYTAHDPVQEQQQRDFMGRMLQAAYQNDAATLQQLFQQMPGGVDYDDCAYAAMERHQRNAAALILNMKYDAEGEDEPRNQWLQEQLRELAESVRDK